LGGVLLVGGSSRIPLVATLLHRAFGVPPTVFEQPELVVAEGALAAADAVRAAPPAAPEPSEPPEEPTAALTSVAAAPAGLRAAAAAAAPSQGARRRLVTSAPFLIAAAVVLVLALGAVAAKVIDIGDGGDGDRSRIGSGPGSGQWAGAGGVVSGSPVPGASGSATPSTAASGTAKPNATAASPTRGGTTGGGSTGGGTSTQTSAPASGDDTKASTIRCTSYRKLSLTRVEGSGGTTPTFEIRGCIWKNNSQVSFSYDYRMDTARKTGYQFYPLGMYKCDADLLSNLGQHSGSGTIAYDDGEISAGGVKRGQATSYHGQGDFQVSVTDDAGNKWSTNGTAVTLRTLCLDE
jgi:hypothetical protein